MADAPNELLTGLLKDVSRSFYLTLRVLPNSIRPQIGLAYLLARTTDTIADTGLVPLEQRLRLLQALRDRILGACGAPLDFGPLMRHQGSPAERALLEKCEAILALLQELPAADRQWIREVLSLITSGQELDLRRFAGASPGQPVALGTEAELAAFFPRFVDHADGGGIFVRSRGLARHLPRPPVVQYLPTHGRQSGGLLRPLCA